MAVESRFVVIRQGVEVETFMDKKAADEYDKMLDMADSLAEMFEGTTLDLNEKIREELCIYLAKNREDVLVALQAKKAKPETTAKKVTVKNEGLTSKTELSADLSATDTPEQENIEPATVAVKKASKPAAKAPRKAKVNKDAA
jgi:dsDNA-binding SOS-regulon protein